MVSVVHQPGHAVTAEFLAAPIFPDEGAGDVEGKVSQFFTDPYASNGRVLVSCDGMDGVALDVNVAV